MIIWLNGPFGVGKTTTAASLLKNSANWRVFDPEHVGYMLQANLKDLDFGDFQHLQPWRNLVPHTLREVERLTATNLIAPQSVLVKDYWDELKTKMTDLGLEVFHVVLNCDENVLAKRIEDDKIDRDACVWRTEHIAQYSQARTWMTAFADLTIDTSALTPDQISTAILGTLRWK
ncbi:MAG: AAA family ATPase [Acidimicrobiales bacterium]